MQCTGCMYAHKLQLHRNDYGQLHTCQKAGYLSAFQACWCYTTERRVHMCPASILYQPACKVGVHTIPHAILAVRLREHQTLSWAWLAGSPAGSEA